MIELKKIVDKSERRKIEKEKEKLIKEVKKNLKKRRRSVELIIELRKKIFKG